MDKVTAVNGSEAVRLQIPNLTRLSALAFAAMIFYGGLRTILITGQLPLIWPIIAAFLCVAFLWAANRARDPVAGLARLGFHLGLFAYFLSLPILFPETIEPGLPDSVHRAIGWMLLLTILGFEGGYKLKTSLWRVKQSDQPTHNLLGWQRRFGGICIAGGLAMWFLATVDYSIAADVPVWDVLFSMRGRVEGNIENPVTQFGVWSYLLTGGLYLATAAAFLLLLDGSLRSRKKGHPLANVACWAVLVLATLVGFLSGSRALFLYCFAPLAMAFWVRLSGLRLRKALRLLTVFGIGAVVLFVWLAMTSMRGGDVRTYEGSFEEIQKPLEAARGAFDIYTSSAVIVQSFPDKIDYEYGRSLIPLVLGWLPRSLWPNKPYPFSIYSNTIRGETLDDRSASIAVGLPGEGYGNFGLAGCFLWGALMGAACAVGDDYLKRLRPSDPLRLFLGASMCIWAAMIVRGGVPEMFYMGLPVNLFPIVLSIALRRLGRARRDFGMPRTIAGAPLTGYRPFQVREDAGPEVTM